MTFYMLLPFFTKENVTSFMYARHVGIFIYIVNAHRINYIY